MTATAGFAAPVFDSARVFRAVLEAMARPGTVHCLKTVPVPPEPLSPADAAMALALVDGDAPAWLAPRLRHEAVDRYLRFHTGAAPVANPGLAAFAFGAWADLAAEPFARGTPDYPDRGTTLVIAVPRLRMGEGVRLTGPGIAQTNLLDAGLPADFWQMRVAQAAGFPVGVDVILTCEDRIAALPRTTCAEV
jgi:alpha-D-ribose 1-methylphosphonate 5-triphosphate synthase subunit PhnH